MLVTIHKESPTITGTNQEGPTVFPITTAFFLRLGRLTAEVIRGNKIKKVLNKIKRMMKRMEEWQEGIADTI